MGIKWAQDWSCGMGSAWIMKTLPGGSIQLHGFDTMP